MTSSDAETDSKPIIIIVSVNFDKSMDVALERMRCLTNPGDDANQKWVCLTV